MEEATKKPPIRYITEFVLIDTEPRLVYDSKTDAMVNFGPNTPGVPPTPYYVLTRYRVSLGHYNTHGPFIIREIVSNEQFKSIAEKAGKGGPCVLLRKGMSLDFESKVRPMDGHWGPDVYSGCKKIKDLK